MKNLYYFGVLFSIVILSSVYGINDILEEADSLISLKKYNSAFRFLNKNDPDNDSPECVLKKVDIALNYYAASLMHQLFGFKDLEDGESLDDVRGSVGHYETYMFDIPKALGDLITEYPSHFELYKSLGSFYHEVHLKYGGSWIESDSELVDLFEEAYRVAYENGVYDYYSAFGIGYAMLYKGEYNKSIRFFMKSLELNEEYAPSHYNLSYAYLNIDDRISAIKQAQRALDLYTSNTLKADAADIIALSYAELGDYDNAIKYYRISDELNPGSYHTLKALLNLELYTKDLANAKLITQRFFNLEPDNPTILTDLLNLYISNDYAEELLNFLTRQKDECKNEPLILGNLHFYSGQLCFFLEDYERSRLNFVEARKTFTDVLDLDRSVFSIIDDYLAKIDTFLKTK